LSIGCAPRPYEGVLECVLLLLLCVCVGVCMCVHAVHPCVSVCVCAHRVPVACRMSCVCMCEGVYM